MCVLLFKNNIFVNNKDMNNNIFNKNLINFINESTSSFITITKIKSILKENGFKELKEANLFNLKDKKYYIVRNDSSIIAFVVPDNPKYFTIITTHSDTPSLLLKPNGNFIKDDYLKYNIMPYGGISNIGWLDTPLSCSGRIITKKNDELKTKIVDIKNPIMIIPSVAIHEMPNINTNLDLNSQSDMQPIVSLSNNLNDWNKILRSFIKEEIVDYELFLYNPIKPSLIGKDNELLLSPRIDNITSVYAGLFSFINSKSNSIKVFASFNSEEIGSLTIDGADSNFLLDILKKICANIKIDFVRTLSSSIIVSSDNTHALHPNHTEFSDDTGSAHLGKGFTIIKESLSTTNSRSMSIIKTICDKNNIKYQISTCRNDVSTGSTLSGLSISHVSILSIDVGIAELSMHSSLETCAVTDIYELYKMMKSLYETNITITSNSIKLS